MRFIFSYAQTFKEKYACFTPQSSCKSLSEQIHIPFLSVLLFVLACISTRISTYVWCFLGSSEVEAETGILMRMVY